MPDPCSFCDAESVEKFAIKHVRESLGPNGLVKIGPDWHLLLYGCNEIYIKVYCWRFNPDDGSVYLGRCRGCWMRHQKMAEVVCVLTDSLSSEDSSCVPSP